MPFRDFHPGRSDLHDGHTGSSAWIITTKRNLKGAAIAAVAGKIRSRFKRFRSQGAPQGPALAAKRDHPALAFFFFIGTTVLSAFVSMKSSTSGRILSRQLLPAKIP